MLFSLLLACSTPQPETPSAPVASAPAATPAAAPATDHFGGPVDASVAVSVDELIAHPENYSGKPVTVKGTVREVCQKKGCWHTLASSDPAVNLMVKDKEYAIFLPKDCAGRTAVIQGNFSVETMPLEEARHYAEDAGKDPATITEPQKSFLMDANGVQLI